MKILGVDYGKRRLGLAYAESSLASPYKVISFDSQENALSYLSEEIRRNDVKFVVFGISEGKMAEDTYKFAKRLKAITKIRTAFQDETLSTNRALSLSLNANIKRKKRKLLKDAYSAAIILQDFLDSNSKLFGE